MQRANLCLSHEPVCDYELQPEGTLISFLLNHADLRYKFCSRAGAASSPIVAGDRSSTTDQLAGNAFADRDLGSASTSFMVRRAKSLVLRRSSCLSMNFNRQLAIANRQSFTSQRCRRVYSCSPSRGDSACQECDGEKNG